jgi:hypothetical protein
MSQQFGVLNGNSHTSRYVRDAQNKTPKTPKVNTFDLVAFAERAAERYTVALLVIRGGLILKGLMLAREFERQLTMLAEYADEEAETA